MGYLTHVHQEKYPPKPLTFDPNAPFFCPKPKVRWYNSGATEPPVSEPIGPLSSPMDMPGIASLWYLLLAGLLLLLCLLLPGALGNQHDDLQEERLLPWTASTRSRPSPRTMEGSGMDGSGEASFEGSGENLPNEGSGESFSLRDSLQWNAAPLQTQDFPLGLPILALALLTLMASGALVLWWKRGNQHWELAQEQQDPEPLQEEGLPLLPI